MLQIVLNRETAWTQWKDVSRVRPPPPVAVAATVAVAAGCGCRRWMVRASSRKGACLVQTDVSFTRCFMGVGLQDSLAGYVCTVCFV